MALAETLRTLLLVAAPVVGLTEIGAMLGVTPHQASRIVASHADFPKPIASFQSGRVWHRASVDVWRAADIAAARREKAELRLVDPGARP